MSKSVKEEFLGALESVDLAFPEILTLMITGGCNLRCIHCWPQCCSYKVASPVPIEKLQKLLKGSAELGIEKMCITGGEPLTHPDWFKILEFTCNLPKLKEVVFQTNGTLLGEQEAKGLACMECERLIIQVSLDGANSDSHDWIRGSGSFEKALQGLKFLVDSGLGKQTEICFTEMKHNFRELPELLELVGNLGLRRIVTGTLVRAGRAAKTDEVEMPTASQYRDLVGLYNENAEFRELYETKGNIACLEWYKGRSSFCSERCACVHNPYVTAEGKMYPCVMLPIEKYAIEGAYEDSLGSLLEKSTLMWRELAELQKQRADELNECLSCPGRLHCEGGCLGRAYVTHGNPMTVEDRCELRKLIYSWKSS